MLRQFLGTPSFHALCLVLVSTAAIESLIAIWAATSRRHWFWRALAVWAGVAVLLPIRAYQPALLFVISSSLTIALILLIQSRTSTSPGQAAATPAGWFRAIRFGLRDLLLLMVIIGLSLTVALHLTQRVGKSHVAEFLLLTLAQTTIATLVWACMATKRTIIFHVALLVAMAGFALSIYAIQRWIGSDWVLIGVLYESLSSHFGVILGSVTALGELALLLLAALAFAQPSRSPAVPAKWLGRLRAALVGLAVAWSLCLAFIYWQMLFLLPLPPSFSTAPTNYHRLVEIAERMWAIDKAGFPASMQAERLALIAETVDLADAANFIPYDLPADATIKAWNKILAPHQLVRNLARTIDAEGGAALSRGQPDEACTLALTNVRHGLMLQRGSTQVDFLIGVAVQSIADKRLAAMRRDLSPDQARRVISTWGHALAEAESIESIVRRDRAMAERAYGWAARLMNILERAGIASDMYSFYREPRQRRDTAAHLLQADLAIRLYQREHGELPHGLDQLVPTYLSAVPLDPYANQPLRYRISAPDFILYSIGTDGVDNAGTFTNLATYHSRDSNNNLVTGYDFDLDTLIRP